MVDLILTALYFGGAAWVIAGIYKRATASAQEAEAESQRAAQAAERERRKAWEASEAEARKARQAREAEAKKAAQAERRAERQRKAAEREAKQAAERAAKLEEARKLAEYEERALAARREREEMERKAAGNAAETVRKAEPAARDAAETVCKAEPAAQAAGRAADPVRAELKPANEAKEYRFDGDVMYVNGHPFEVSFTISRRPESRIPTVTALCWVTIQGERRRVGIRFERGSRHHAAALAAAEESAERYRASRAA